MTDFVDANEFQPSLFFNSDSKHKKLMEAIDELNRKYHKDAVRIDTLDPRKHKMCQEHLSKHLTPNIN